MSAGLIYVYCIGTAAVTGALPSLEGLEKGATPYAIEARGLIAVVSDVPAEQYAEEPLNARITDIAWVGEKGVAHERVVETCYLAGPTIPLRFGTIFQSRANVEALIATHEGRLREILERLSGKAEWGLRAYVDRPRFEAFLAAAGPAGGAASASAGGRGRAYLEKKKAEQDSKKLSGEAIARALAETLAAHAAVATLHVRQPVAEGGGLSLKAALLVPLEQRAAFEAAAAAERDRLEPCGIRVEMTGPWPPYAFVPSLEKQEARA